MNQDSLKILRWLIDCDFLNLWSINYHKGEAPNTLKKQQGESFRDCNCEVGSSLGYALLTFINDFVELNDIPCFAYQQKYIQGDGRARLVLYLA